MLRGSAPERGRCSWGRGCLACDRRGFRDGFLPHFAAAVKDFCETLEAYPTLHVILTHQRNGLHQDHRLACDLTCNTFRDQQVLEYEIPRWDRDMGAPSSFA